MSCKRDTGQWWEFSDALGIDPKYAAQKARADRELADALAGPNESYPVIAPDGIEMKNPGGEFQCPAAMHVAPMAAILDKEKIR